MKFKTFDEPVCSTEPHYDVLEGGYINPEKILRDEADIREVRKAIQLINHFLYEAEEAGTLEIC